VRYPRRRDERLAPKGGCAPSLCGVARRWNVEGAKAKAGLKDVMENTAMLTDDPPNVAVNRRVAPPRVLIVQHGRYSDTPGVLRGIMHYQKSHGPWITFVDDLTRTDKDLKWLNQQRWSGVISGVNSSAVADVCRTLGVPVVELWDSPARNGVPRVRPDNIAVGHMAAEHLLERRFRRFAFSGFRGVAWSSERLAGFREALELVGFACAAHEAKAPVEPTPAWEAEQIELLAGWLRALPRETAVLGCDDERARQVARAAALARLRVPQDVAIMGVNNDVVRCEQESPLLSSVATDDFTTGVRAAEWLDALMDGRAKAEAEWCVEPVGVAARESTDVLEFRDKHVAAAVSYIREHACRGLTVDEVVAQVHASRSQLENRFRRFLGHSPQVEIRRVQLEKVRALLAGSDLTLKEIADRAGFMHVEYLSVVFKRLTGETPGQYRRNVQSQERVRACS